MSFMKTTWNTKLLVATIKTLKLWALWKLHETQTSSCNYQNIKIIVKEIEILGSLHRMENIINPLHLLWMVLVRYQVDGGQM